MTHGNAVPGQFSVSVEKIEHIFSCQFSFPLMEIFFFVVLASENDSLPHRHEGIVPTPLKCKVCFLFPGCLASSTPTELAHTSASIHLQAKALNEMFSRISKMSSARAANFSQIALNESRVSFLSYITRFGNRAGLADPRYRCRSS